MTWKRNWSNFAVLCLACLLLVAIWPIIRSPTMDMDPEFAEPQIFYTLYTNETAPYAYPVTDLPQDDYYRLIDLQFNFTTLSSVCNGTAGSPLVLVMVHTSPENFAKRKTIRETWGRSRYGDKVALAFVLGSVKNSTLDSRLQEENQNYSDFVQGSFDDTYRNLTYKHVMVFKYAIYHCPDAKYIVKTDDDVFINMPTMLNFLTNDISSNGAKDLLFCMVRRNSKVIRSYRSKWRVSFDEFPDRFYPPHCPGWFLLYSQNVIFGLYKLAQHSPYFWIDDVHITGTLFQELGLFHTDAAPYYMSSATFKTIESGGNYTKPFLIGWADITEKAIRSLWNYVESQPVPKSVVNGPGV